jgi:osmotically-inducible protein OsmY
MIKNDMQLKRDIEEELRDDPRINAARIGVTVDKGAVSLLGSVDTFPEKWAAEDAAKRVAGVRTIAQDLTVQILADHVRSDSEIASATQSVLAWDVLVPKTVTAKITNGVVTLEGQVAWNYQREAAERAVRRLVGVTAVTNAMTLAAQTSAVEVKERIQVALQRQAKADSKSIDVDASNGKVTLSGHASSWQSIEDAANAAWGVSGVTEVVDHVRVQMTMP